MTILIRIFNGKSIEFLFFLVIGIEWDRINHIDVLIFWLFLTIWNSFDSQLHPFKFCVLRNAWQDVETTIHEQFTVSACLIQWAILVQYFIPLLLKHNIQILHIFKSRTLLLTDIFSSVVCGHGSQSRHVCIRTQLVTSLFLYIKIITLFVSGRPTLIQQQFQWNLLNLLLLAWRRHRSWNSHSIFWLIIMIDEWLVLIQAAGNLFISVIFIGQYLVIEHTLICIPVPPIWLLPISRIFDNRSLFLLNDFGYLSTTLGRIYGIKFLHNLSISALNLPEYDPLFLLHLYTLKFLPNLQTSLLRAILFWGLVDWSVVIFNHCLIDWAMERWKKLWTILSYFGRKAFILQANGWQNTVVLSWIDRWAVIANNWIDRGLQVCTALRLTSELKLYVFKVLVELRYYRLGVFYAIFWCILRNKRRFRQTDTVLQGLQLTGHSVIIARSHQFWQPQPIPLQDIRWVTDHINIFPNIPCLRCCTPVPSPLSRTHHHLNGLLTGTIW